LGSKCGKTHLRASVKSKNFPGAMPPDPQGNTEKGGEGKEGQGRGREVEGRERMGWGRERKGREGREEGREREGRREGRGGQRNGSNGNWGEVCVMVFGGMDAPYTNRRGLAQGCAFWGLIDYTSNHGSNPQKPLNRGQELAFPA
jgi:hypothetical protein